MNSGVVLSAENACHFTLTIVAAHKMQNGLFLCNQGKPRSSNLYQLKDSTANRFRC